MTDDLLALKLERLRYLKELQQELRRAEQIDAGTYRPPWEEIRRPEQEAPPGNWFVWLILAGRGWGKMLDVGTSIPTPSGWVKLSDISVGSDVFDEAGRICQVTATFDATPQKSYRVHFSDGTYIDACADHQWVTWTHAERIAFHRSSCDKTRFPDEWPQWRNDRALGPQIRATQQIVDTLTYGRNDNNNHCIPLCGSLQLPDAELPIDPYVFGCWLGDGDSSGAAITCLDEEILAELKRRGVKITPHRVAQGKSPKYGISMADGRSIWSILKKLGLLNNKHVPAIYLRGSVQQRTDLLQGLMDTDGYAESSKVEFSNTNKLLIDAVMELARSLGQKPREYYGRAKIYGRDCGPKWRVVWRPTINVFRLDRKAVRVGSFIGRQSLRNNHRMITAVEQIDPAPMRCLTVSSTNSMFLAGEGMIPTHNTRTASEWALEKARKYPGCRIALVASTIADSRDTMVEGESGLLNCLKNEELRGGNEENAWNRSLVELFLANGSRFKGFSSEKPRKLRGPQFHFAIADESAFWTDAFKGTITDTTWSNLAIATRLPRRYDWSADYLSQICVATTPRPVALLTSADPDPARAGLMQRESTIITRGRTVDNLENLSEQYRVNVIAPLLGTRLGRQELDAELLEDRSDALWRRDWIDGTRIAPSAVPDDLVRVVVAVDPAVSDGETAAETGIVVAGADRKGHGYILGDYTLRGSPQECMSEAIRVYNIHQADRIVAEINNGGDYIGAVLKAINPDVPYRTVRATRGKVTRAEPVSAMYEQGRIHHAGQFTFLEDQLCTWSPTDEISPDRLDALVWSLTDMKDLVQSSWSQAYGVVKCSACKAPFFRVINGTPRTNCIKCGAPLPTEEESDSEMDEDSAAVE